MGESQNAWDMITILISKQASRKFSSAQMDYYVHFIAEKNALTLSYNPSFKESYDRFNGRRAKCFVA